MEYPNYKDEIDMIIDVYTIDIPGLQSPERFNSIDYLRNRLVQLVYDRDEVINCIIKNGDWRGETKDGWNIRVYRQRVRGFE